MTDSAELIARARKIASMPEGWAVDSVFVQLIDALDEQKTWLDQCRKRLEAAEAENERLREALAAASAILARACN